MKDESDERLVWAYRNLKTNIWFYRASLLITALFRVLILLAIYYLLTGAISSYLARGEFEFLRPLEQGMSFESRHDKDPAELFYQTFSISSGAKFFLQIGAGLYLIGEIGSIAYSILFLRRVQRNP
jgi:hypothetical protein